MSVNGANTLCTFDKSVWIMTHNLAVLAGAWLALVRIHNQVLFTTFPTRHTPKQSVEAKTRETLDTGCNARLTGLARACP